MGSSLKFLYQSHDGFVSDKWESYLEIYEEKFKEFKYNRVKLLEIGVQNGGSLEIWDKYFPNAQLILGCDINPLCKTLKFSSNKIKVILANASNPKTKNLISKYSSKFDVIIDDGSHKDRDTILNFINYFPLLEKNGLYIIEDLHCSYWRTHTSKPGNFSPMEFFKLALDIINQEFWEEFFYEKHRKKMLKLLAALDIDFLYDDLVGICKNIYSMEFYNSLLILRKRESKLGKRIIAGKQALVDDAILKHKTY